MASKNQNSDGMRVLNNKNRYQTQIRNLLNELDPENSEELYIGAQGLYIEIDTNGENIMKQDRALVCIAVKRGTEEQKYKNYLSSHSYHVCDMNDPNSPCYLFKFDASMINSIRTDKLEPLGQGTNIRTY